ncbi:hypothetical protein [Chryseobacterium cucumeris]|uniref:hypothetical protein n=1 Tax=Chryseobacterium cucumeris TaxID=1813611 RepID=UPI001F4AE7CD|nr:hypothetical protein [Chryseobacterium cucumeris]
MKKVLAIAFIGGLLLASCSKKVDHSLQDTNTMLPEPEVATVDSTAKTAAPAAATPAVAAPEAAKTDSTAKK